MLDNYISCPICGALHDDGAFILTESGNTYFICFDCDEKYTGDRARKILEEKERSFADGHFNTENNGYFNG